MIKKDCRMEYRWQGLSMAHIGLLRFYGCSVKLAERCGFGKTEFLYVLGFGEKRNFALYKHEQVIALLYPISAIANTLAQDHQHVQDLMDRI